MKMHIKYESLNPISNIFNQLIFEVLIIGKSRKVDVLCGMPVIAFLTTIKSAFPAR